MTSITKPLLEDPAPKKKKKIDVVRLILQLIVTILATIIIFLVSAWATKGIWMSTMSGCSAVYQTPLQAVSF